MRLLQGKEAHAVLLSLFRMHVQDTVRALRGVVHERSPTWLNMATTSVNGLTY